MFLVTGFKKVSKTEDKNRLWKLFTNTASWRLMISDSLITFKSWNKGLERSVKLEKVIIFIAFFCNLNKGCTVDWYESPQTITQWFKNGSSKV